jgi:hypothetical protein
MNLFLLLRALQGTDDAKTAAALRAAFREASRFSPCILMLQHLELLTATKGEPCVSARTHARACMHAHTRTRVCMHAKAHKNIMPSPSLSLEVINCKVRNICVYVYSQ